MVSIVAPSGACNKNEINSLVQNLQCVNGLTLNYFRDFMNYHLLLFTII